MEDEPARKPQLLGARLDGLLALERELLGLLEGRALGKARLDLERAARDEERVQRQPQACRQRRLVVEVAPRRACVLVHRDTPLRTLIDARLKHSGPFIVREGGTVSGLIRDEDLFRCLTNTRLAG